MADLLLILDKPGVYVKKEGRTIRIRKGDEMLDPISITKVSAILVLTKVTITHDVFTLCAQYGVPIIYCKRREPIGVFHSFFNHGTVQTRREQILALYDERGLHLAKKFAIAAIKNKISILKYYGKLRQGDSDLLGMLDDVIAAMDSSIYQIVELNGPLEKVRMKIMGLEGEAAHRYYSFLKWLLPDDLGYTGRNRRPPLDPVNAALSFGYSIVYSKTLIAIAATGLEPYAGFLHTDRSGKPSLVLDLSEEFKQWIVDRTVLSLFNRKALKKEQFEKRGGGIFASEDAKKVLLEEIGKRINKKVKVSMFKTKVTPMSVIMTQARKIVRYLMKIDKEYIPFVWEGR